MGRFFLMFSLKELCERRGLLRSIEEHSRIRWYKSQLYWWQHWFQQDGATHHGAKKCLKLLELPCARIANRVISHTIFLTWLNSSWCFFLGLINGRSVQITAKNVVLDRELDFISCKPWLPVQLRICFRYGRGTYTKKLNSGFCWIKKDKVKLTTFLLICIKRNVFWCKIRRIIVGLI